MLGIIRYYLLKLEKRLFPETYRQRMTARAEKLRRDNARMQAAMQDWDRQDYISQEWDNRKHY